MNVIHVVSSIEAEASGPSYSVPALHAAMIAHGARSRLAVTGKPGQNRPDEVYVFPRLGFPYRLGRSPEMHRWLRDAAEKGEADVIHTHGLWMMPNVYPGWVTRSGKPLLVVSPRGTLSRWALDHSRLRKRVMWRLAQRNAIESSGIFHATSEDECQDIRRQNFRQPIALVPNGVAIPKEFCRTPHADRTLLFLSRIHPKKGLELLLKSWSSVQYIYQDWRLSIVGPGDPVYIQELKELAKRLGVVRSTFHGPLFGAEKERAYAQADLFVLPTHSENFGMAVAEALAAGCPVVTTKGAPWSGLRDHGAGWWTDIDAVSLQSALAEAMSLPAGELSAMGARGRAWMERDFSWQRVAGQMLETYRWANHGGPTPVWVHT